MLGGIDTGCWRTTRIARAAAALLLVLANTGTYAQAMGDPMRPAEAGAAPDAAKAGPGPGGPTSRLQSVLISPNRRLAVIDGNTVPLGGRVGDATLVSITESEAVLAKGNVRETLRLSPGVQKTPVLRQEPPKVTQ